MAFIFNLTRNSIQDCIPPPTVINKHAQAHQQGQIVKRIINLAKLHDS